MVKSDVSSRASSASAINPSPVLFLDEAALIFHPRFLRNADGAASWNRDQPTVSVECLPRQVARVRPCKKYRHTRGLDRLPYETQRNGALERLARFVGRYVLTIGIGGDDRIDHVHADAILARSEEHTSELQSLMRISYAVFCLKKKQIRHRGEPDV